MARAISLDDINDGPLVVDASEAPGFRLERVEPPSQPSKGLPAGYTNISTVIEYPKWLYHHASRQACKVHTREQELALGDGWSEAPDVETAPAAGQHVWVVQAKTWKGPQGGLRITPSDYDPQLQDSVLDTIEWRCSRCGRCIKTGPDMPRNFLTEACYARSGQ